MMPAPGKVALEFCHYLEYCNGQGECYSQGWDLPEDCRCFKGRGGLRCEIEDPEEAEKIGEKINKMGDEKTEKADGEKIEEAYDEKIEEAAEEKVEEDKSEDPEEAEKIGEKTEKADGEKIEEADGEKIEEAYDEKIEEAAEEKVEEDKREEFEHEKVDGETDEKEQFNASIMRRNNVSNGYVTSLNTTTVQENMTIGHEGGMMNKTMQVVAPGIVIVFGVGMLMYLVYLVVGGITRLYRTASGYGGINNDPDLESARNVLNENLKQDD